MLRSSLSSPNLRIYNSIDATRMLPLDESDHYDRSADGLLAFPSAVENSFHFLGRSSDSLHHSAAGYGLSSNPPEKPIRFRDGDWVCDLITGQGGCGAHNFGRNERCFGCGRSRPSTPLSRSSSSPVGQGDISPVVIYPATNTQSPIRGMLIIPFISSIPPPFLS